MKLRKNIATSENGFIFNPATGDSYSGNAIAAEILSMMKNGQIAEEIKATILEKYDAEPNQLDKDWEDWMLQLKQANLLDE